MCSGQKEVPSAHKPVPYTHRSGRDVEKVVGVEVEYLPQRTSRHARGGSLEASPYRRGSCLRNMSDHIIMKDTGVYFVCVYLFHAVRSFATSSGSPPIVARRTGLYPASRARSADPRLEDVMWVHDIFFFETGIQTDIIAMLRARRAVVTRVHIPVWSLDAQSTRDRFHIVWNALEQDQQ